jgi:hypothetical protein
MARAILSTAALTALLMSVMPVSAADDVSQAGPEKYTLRYQFHPGDVLRWNVVHRCRIRTSVSDSTQNAETNTTSVKLWRVRAVTPDGTATFEHLVESVDMRQSLTGREDVHYDSKTDLHAPPGFEDVAQAVGVTLSVVTMDVQGKVLQRKRSPIKASIASEGDMTVRMPDGPIAVGHEWSFPHDIEVPLPGGGIKKIKSVQTFKLLSVKTGVASIRVATQILTPLNDPALESQVMQYESSGTVRFDIDAGRMLGQQMDVDRGVVGFRGEASSIRYASRFTEEFLSVRAAAEIRTSRR